ncbi:MAG: glycosyltransferase family 87 protein [Terriglobales bacterium]
MTFAAFARKPNFIIVAFLLGMMCCNLTLAFRVVTPLREGLQDFTIYYMAGRLVREGRAAEIYDTAVQYHSQLEFALIPKPEDLKPFNHPAFEALLFVPFTFLPFWPAYLVWTLLSLTLLAIATLFLKRLPKIRELPALLLGLASLTFFPVVMGLLMGQDSVLLLLLFVMALISLYRGSDAAAGAWLAGGLFRPHMILPMVLLLAARRWRLLLGFAPIALLAAGISVALVGWKGSLAYVQFVLQGEHPHGGFLPRHLPTLRGLISVLPGVRDSPHLTAILILASSLAVFGLALHRIRQGQDSVGYAFCLASVTTLLVSFHAFSYDLTLLLPLVLFMLSAAIGAEGKERQAQRMVLLFLLFLTPLYIYLVMVVRVFLLFSMVLLWLDFRLLAMRAPAGEPA